ncbi:hypothetical protein H6G54_04540 [Anabaena cylindrica FACHB-243]|uniref:Uncharacterized protein n=1 Tax=Anabaena cylindrica (strain ATCC 27899 / PCC 7122) TaxID=272123 RepID=K9ZIL2_ANACC|nr:MULTISPECIES: hypothetical protein [Anabaena]AFZ58397.1 hypothetical protein Anacy_2977 [Anabaena cylindrica PCC 7122]MBD2416993.1 hypothetical protein [Anabaena cylindrica FACHB-243]MBY5280209.1 hypothetical protein [Anabaena sp. CCAP 1446/1C]MBY5309349.1 hypothetical protein [Anabaena sp. CCAP 1446/1C]MCM2406530.1 hypothetical protein [Anabaena sp. CCAP 1446/1C]
MINDQEFLHGAAFLRLIDHGEKITITHASWIHPSIYLVDTESSKSAILFKVSKKPKSAWSFTLSSQEESALNILPNKYDEISLFFALICHKDGICCIPQIRLWSVLDTDMGLAGQHISVSRKPHGSYHVSGPGRQKMDQTVPQNDWPRVLFSK